MDPSSRCPDKNKVAAAREWLDCALATLLEAATAEVCEDAQLRKAVAEGELRERRRLQAILLQRIDMHPFESDPVRGELLQLLEMLMVPLDHKLEPVAMNEARPYPWQRISWGGQ
jgi:hypothetical protein